MCIPIIFGLAVITDAMRSPPIPCSMSGNRVYVAGSITYPDGVIRPRGGGWMRILSGEFLGSERYVYPTPMSVGYPLPMTPLRWRLAGGRLHYLGYVNWPAKDQFDVLAGSWLGSIPLDVMPKSDAPGAANHFWLSALYLKDTICPINRRGRTRLGYELVFQLNRGDPEVIHDAAVVSRPWPYPQSDFLVDPSGGYEELILGKDALTCWKSVPKGDKEEFGWEKGDVIGVDWRGPFIAAASGKDRYIANDRGELYQLPRPAGPGAKSKKVWGGDPILLLASDPESGRTFAFTSSVFFEISKPAAARVHSIAVAKKNTAPENLELSISCCRAISQLTVAAGPDEGPKRSSRAGKED